MTNPVITNSDNLQLEVFNPKYKDVILKFASALTFALGVIMAKLLVSAGAVTADGGNTGNGTVTALALAPGGPPLAGNWNLEATSAGALGRKVGAITPDGGNTGDGTVTVYSITSGDIPEVGDWVLTCTDPDPGGTATAGTATPGGGDTGDGTPSAVTTGTKTLEGTYTLLCIAAAANAGTFSVTDPNGDALEDLTVAVAYLNNHLGLTIADGAADFIVGDSFTILMTIADGGLFKLADPEGTVVKADIQLPGTALGTVIVIAGGITFTITDGATDFAADDFFTLVVAVAHGGTFKLEDPNSVIVKNDIVMPGTAGATLTVIVAGLTFILTDGSTDFVTGDKFALAITDEESDNVPWVEDALDGSGQASGVMPRAETSTGIEDRRRRMLISGEVHFLKLSVQAGGAVPDKAIQQLRDFTILGIDGVRTDILDNQ